MSPAPQLKRPALAPEILAERPPSAEVLVGPNAIVVTVAVPGLGGDGADVVLTRHSIRLRDRRDPGGTNLVVPLPVAVEPERYVLRRVNGVLDFVVERATSG